MLYRLIKPILFRLEPETAHHFVFGLLRLAFRIPGIKKLVAARWSCANGRLQRRVFGIEFPNPIGLAAGFDKDARLIDIVDAFGFGFIEIGTVTPKPQDGNPRPRLFRLPTDQALINRMGFNNDGAEAVVRRLRERSGDIIVGGNIGRNKTTPNENAVDDYTACFEALFDEVDYFVVNVSSPNTPGLRELQDRAPLSHLLLELQARNNAKPKRKPILLKIGPDLREAQLDDIVNIVGETKIDGVIATNTTISRKGLGMPVADVSELGDGGLSGRPLAVRSTAVIRYLTEKSGGRIPIIGVGGITSPQDVQEKLDAGAVLVQVYTGLVYKGAGLVRELTEGLLADMGDGAMGDGGEE